MTTKIPGRPALTPSERAEHVGLRLPKWALTQLEAEVTKANARARKAGLPPAMTLSTLLRMWVLERLTKDNPPRSAQDRVQGPRLTETKPGGLPSLGGKPGPADLTDVDVDQLLDD